ncbi:exo-alpha-sialidase [Streptacidiphilus carbonis]|uniref:exo-alpha-sialidase n=1 Tax=Streptacidiphilus carbonis TaxID=105422 RepID=UPI0006940576|nr:exo-alpha-sialidase [Streptacidiphilus carbonis]
MKRSSRGLLRRAVTLLVTSALLGLGAAWPGPAAAATSITNGGFEASSLSGWTASGPASSVTTTGPHSGTYAAMLGSSSPTNGASSIAQSFTAPAGSPVLSFWYDVTCPDTVTYDWATATLADTTAGTTTTVLAKTCVANSGWKQVSKAVTAGHNYTLTLTSKDDNYTGDPTYTLYDDVALTGGTTTNDFSLTDGPATAAVNPGGSAASTLTTAVTSGAAQTVAFSASGLPAGATATFNPTSVTAGASSTLTVSTTSSTPAGSYPITVTGTGTSATHTTTFTLTVNGSGPSLVQISTDPFTNSTSQHATEVEPDTFAHGSTIVSSSQVGRFYDGGASDISWNTSTDGGATWQHGMLPGITTYQGSGPWARVSDASVSYDAKHGTWMIVGLVLDANVNGAGVTVSRSADGLTWQNPVLAVGNDGQGYDKEWIACDNTSTSPHYGNCYIEADITSSGNQEIMSTSTDGGATWSTPASPASGDSGLGGQPLVQPNGTVVVPFSTDGSSIRAFSSTNGGASWGSSVLVANISAATVSGGLRAGDGLPSAEIDAAGKIYVAWQDCRFRSGCPSNDIVYSTSTNGTSWTAVTRVPIDAVTSSADHFTPGLGVDPTTSGSTAALGLYYYFYPNHSCTAATCQLEVGFTSSTNGGSTWSTARTVAGPMTLAQIASTSQGPMVGDYISTSVVAGKSIGLFPVGKAPTNGQAFDEAMYTVSGGLALRAGTIPSSTGPVRYTAPSRIRLSPPVPLN